MAMSFSASRPARETSDPVPELVLDFLHVFKIHFALDRKRRKAPASSGVVPWVRRNFRFWFLPALIMCPSSGLTGRQVLILLNGGAKGSRTPDLLIANETLYQLSYDPNRGRLKTKANPIAVKIYEWQKANAKLHVQWFKELGWRITRLFSEFCPRLLMIRRDSYVGIAASFNWRYLFESSINPF